MARRQIYAGASKPGDFEVARQQVAERDAALLAKKSPVANPVTERAIKLSFQTKHAILVKHW